MITSRNNCQILIGDIHRDVYMYMESYLVTSVFISGFDAKVRIWNEQFFALHRKFFISTSFHSLQMLFQILVQIDDVFVTQVVSRFESL